MKRAAWLLVFAAMSIQAGASDAPETTAAFNKALVELEQGHSARKVAADRVGPHTLTKLEREAVVRKHTTEVLFPLYQEASKQQEAREAELRMQDAPYMAEAATAHRAMMLEAVRVEQARRPAQWFYSALTVLAIAVAAFVIVYEVRERIKNKRA